MRREQLQQCLPAGGVIQDALTCDQLAVLVEQSDVVVFLAPVDPAAHFQDPPLLRRDLVQVGEPCRGHATP